METQDFEVTVISEDVATIEASQRAEYDVQIATAKKYPRSLSRTREKALEIITMDKATAEQCRYALPRGGKTISGPSVHLARIIIQQYGNVRAEARVKQITDKHIISEAICFDLETNYAIKVEVRRSIMENEKAWDQKQNKFIRTGRMVRMNDDMITMTGNAANSIAFRNAVFNVVPKGVTDVCYNAAIAVITGDISDELKLVKRRSEILDKMKASYNVTDEQILSALGLRSVNQIKTEQIADLVSLGQAIKDGDTTVEQVFNLSDQKTSEEITKENKDILRKKKEAKKIKESGNAQNTAQGTQTEIPDMP